MNYFNLCLYRFVLRQILSNQTPEERVSNICAQLEKLKVDLEENKVPIGLLAISKTLTKSPHDYPDAKALPHVAVAQRLNKQSIKFRQGDTISYVVCEVYLFFFIIKICYKLKVMFIMTHRMERISHQLKEFIT